MLPSGRTILEEFLHRWRGWCQYWMDVEHLYPKRIRGGFIALGLLIVAGAWLRYHSTENHRLLVGSQLERGHLTFTAIRHADDASEDFTNDTGRRKAFAEATTELAVFQQFARTDEEMRAGMILAYYLDEVRQMPDRDRDCAIAMQTAQQLGVKTGDGAPTTAQLTIAEVGELTCMSGRSQAVAIRNLCRDEALSYLIPGRQPPVDACMFRHMAQSDAAR